MSSLNDDSWIQQILELENSDGLEEVDDFDLEDSVIMEMVDTEGNVLASWVRSAEIKQKLDLYLDIVIV